MERDFVLPVIFAAAAHAALLFGFPKNPGAARGPHSEIRIIREFPLMPREEDPPVIAEAEDRAAPAPKPSPEPPPPTSLEPPPIDVASGHVIPVPPLQPFDAADVATIPATAFHVGQRDGEYGIDRRGVIPRSWLDTAPQTRFQPAPFYPPEGRREGLRGEVVVEFIVDENGRVIAPRVVSSSHRMFEEPTLRAIVKWQFEPGRRNGEIVRFRMAVPVIFSLSE